MSTAEVRALTIKEAGQSAEPSKYFSDQECAGGCGNLLPWNMVNIGRRFIYGHKNGCPKDGSAFVKRSKNRSQREPIPRPGPVIVTSYGRTLAMAQENLARLEEVEKQLAEDATNLVNRQAWVQLVLTRLRNLIRALQEMEEPSRAV